MPEPDRLEPDRIPDLCEDLKRLDRDRRYWQQQRIGIGARLGSAIRVRLGWSPDLPAPERKRIAVAAARLIKQNGAGTDHQQLIVATIEAGKEFAIAERLLTKSMEDLAKWLPVYETFVKGCRGFGVGNLARLVAETGDLGEYPSEAALWKRMGLAVRPDGGRDRRVKGESAGYAPRRRALMWNIGACIVRARGSYKGVFDARKAFEGPRVKTKKHAQLRAQRYMEKRLLRDLWRAWRRANPLVADRPKMLLPDAPTDQADAALGTLPSMGLGAGAASPDTNQPSAATDVLRVKRQTLNAAPAEPIEAERAMVPLPARAISALPAPPQPDA